MTDDRDAIITRIREALSGADKTPSSTAPPAPIERSIPECLPPVGSTQEEQLTLLAEKCSGLQVEFKICTALDEAVDHLNRLAREQNWHTVATHRGALTDAVTGRMTPEIYRVDDGFDAKKLEVCDAGITECEALIAQTGSICVTSRSSGGRALSIVVPHHIVLARSSQLLTDLPSAFALLEQKYAATGYPSFLSFITGPSRTADIERTLVFGAHGPKKLTLLLLPASLP